MMAGMKTRVPCKSNSWIRAFQPRLAIAFRSGLVKKIRIMMAVIAPKGRLI
jgi:hypothetical protein